MALEPVDVLAPRAVIQPNKRGLSLIALGSGTVAIACLWLGWNALTVGGFAGWLIGFASAMGICAFGALFGWSLWRRSIKEPAVILDEAGLLDNVSVVTAGRLNWRQIERIWFAGPNWMPFLCVLPRDARSYIEGQCEWRRAIMRVNEWLFGAVVAIPIPVLKITVVELRMGIRSVELASRAPDVSLI